MCKVCDNINKFTYHFYDLKWNANLSEVLKKGASRLLPTTKTKNIATKDILSRLYLVCVYPITEYACQVFHNTLVKYLSDDLERLLKRALQILFPEFFYKEALNASNLPRFREKRRHLTTTLFKEAVEKDSHKLHKLSPPV